MAVLVAFAAIVAGSASGEDAALDPATLRARIAAAAGRSPDNVRETIVSGDLTETSFRRESDVRIVSDNGSIHSERGVAHGEAWHQDSNGLTVVDEPATADNVRSATTTTVVRVSRPVDAYKLAVLDSSGYGTVEFVDPTTYRIVRRERISAVNTFVTSYDEFASFAGRQLPSRWTTTDTATNTQRVFTRREYREGAVTNSDVSEPAIRRTLVEFPAGVTTVELPARFEHDRIYVHVTVGNRPLDFILGSGDSSISIDENVARELGLSLLNARSRVTADRFTQYDTTVPAIAIGPLTMRNIVLRTIPHGTLTEVSPGFAGVLGFDFLAQLGVTIDYQQRRVTVRPASVWVAPHGPNVLTVPVRFPGGLPEVAVAINGQVGEHFVLDTGGNGSLLVTDAFMRLHGKALGALARRSTVTGVGGSAGATAYLVNSVTLSSVHFHDIRVTRVDSPRNYPGDIDGLVGTDLLHYFTLDLHYADGTVYLTRNGIL